MVYGLHITGTLSQYLSWDINIWNQSMRSSILGKPMRNVFCATCFLLMICCVSPVGDTASAQPPVYTLEDCLAIGLQRAEQLQNAFRDEQIAATRIGELRAQILPQLSASAGYTRLDRVDDIEFGGQSVELGSQDNLSADITLRQLVYAGGAVRAGLRAARDYRDMTTHQTALVRAGLIRDIRSGFVDLLLLERVIAVHEQTVDQLRDVVAQTEQRFAQDLASEFDTLNARVRLANAVPGLIQASNNWLVARTAFGNLINVDDTDFAIAGELYYEPYEAPLEPLAAQALTMRPEILAMEQRLALQDADIRSEQGSYYPNIHLTAGYSGQDPPGMIATDSGWDWGWSVGIRAQWDWFDGGARHYRVRQKQMEREKSLADRSALHRHIMQQVHQAWLRVRHAAEAVAASHETVALADKSLAIAETRYETGLTTRLEYTEISLARMEAQLNRLQAIRDHQQAVNALRYAIGDYN